MVERHHSDTDRSSRREPINSGTLFSRSFARATSSLRIAPPRAAVPAATGAPPTLSKRKSSGFGSLQNKDGSHKLPNHLFRQGDIQGITRKDTVHSSADLHAPKTFLHTVALDEKRKALLQVARIASPATSFQLTKLGNTVVPRVIWCPLTWLTFSAYAITAGLVRAGVWSNVAAGELDALESQGMSTLVTFMIVFYVGYCYDRHYTQYLQANIGRNALVDCCAMAGAYLVDEADSERLWRHLNLAHALAFVGLSSTYTSHNLLNGFIDEHQIDVPPEELAQLKAIGVESGPGAYLFSVQRALLALSEASERTDGHSGVHFMKIHSMQNEILLFRRSISMVKMPICSMAALYAYHFQVIPYVYTHMISLVSTLYLVTFAVLKGTTFEPGSSVAFGLIFPLLSLVLMTVSSIGLIEVGSTLANPWGGEAEDFAVFHFIDSAAARPHAMHVPTTAPEPWGLLPWAPLPPVHTRSLVKTSHEELKKSRTRKNVCAMFSSAGDSPRYEAAFPGAEPGGDADAQGCVISVGAPPPAGGDADGGEAKRSSTKRASFGGAAG